MRQAKGIGITLIIGLSTEKLASRVIVTTVELWIIAHWNMTNGCEDSGVKSAAMDP